MRRRCPWCLEPLRPPLGALCAHCGRPLAAADGSELRPVDLRSDEVETEQCVRFRHLMIVGTPAAAGIALLAPLAHVAAVAVAPLWAALHLLVVRLYLTAATYRLLSPVRRRFNRWLGRFAFLWLGVPGYAAMAAPAVGVVAGAATFAGLTAIAHGYGLWSLRRERDRVPLASWEMALLAVLALVTLVVVLTVVVMALLLGWSLSALLHWLGARAG